MGSGFIYPEVIARIRAACVEHIAGRASADELQRVVQLGENAIVAIDETDLREFLTGIEGRLEFIKSMLPDDKQIIRSRSVAKEVLSWLLGRERGEL